VELVKFIKQQLIELDSPVKAQQLWSYSLHAMRDTIIHGKYIPS